MTTNMTTVIATAAATPSHTHFKASRRCILTRNATRTITTIPASRPSRRPIRPLPKSCAEIAGVAVIGYFLVQFGKLSKDHHT